MPQDSLKSVVYRSFVTCDDPKGVVECKTTRKSKKMEDKTKNQRIQQDSNTSKSYEEERKDKVPKVSIEELQNLSSVQIMEVSRGARKLNEVIDSWSNRTSFEKRSKNIAKDLLKGAVDLEESLVMLGKLQEASQYIVKSKKRHKEKLIEGRTMPFGYYNQAMDFQKPRISADASSRDCYDELREVIRESFARQNLLPKVSAKEKDCIDRKNLDLCVDFPSSSSSQSSLIYSHSSSCSPSKVQNEKPKGPNLIAKLMGLEEVASKAVNPIIYKQMEKEKLSNQRCHLLDIVLPRARKPQFMVQKVVQERRSLEEIIQAMQFKGLLGRKSIDGSIHGKDCFDDSYMRRSTAVEGTPIVLMRPRHVRDHHEFHENYWFNEEKPTKSRQMPRKMREELPIYSLDIPKQQWKFIETNEKLRARSTLKQKLSNNKEDKDPGESHARVVDKTLDSQDRLSKIRHSKPPVPRVQKDEVIVRKMGNTPIVGSTRKHADEKDAKSQESLKNQDLGENATLKHGKIARGSNVRKWQIAHGKTAKADKPVKPASLKSSSPKKNLQKGKPHSRSSAALVENLQSDDNLPNDTESDIQGSLVKSTTCEQIIENMMNASCISISDNSGNTASPPYETSVLSLPTIEEDVRCIQDGSYSPCHNSDEAKGCKSISNTSYILMTSASFLSRAEELFDTGTTCDPSVSLPGSEILDPSLLLECANEILERKSLHLTTTMQPLSGNLFMKRQIYVSLDQLVGEISDGIEALRNYSKSGCDMNAGDSIYSMLERDVWWNGQVTGAWDLGWRNGFTVEEVHELVNDVEKLVLSEIVNDVITEFI